MALGDWLELAGIGVKVGVGFYVRISSSFGLCGYLVDVPAAILV